MKDARTFSRRVFFWAAVYGIAVLAPFYFLEGALAERFPPAQSHPEQYYAFIGVALAWQLAFFVIARDVVRYRLLMLPAVAEKWLSSTSVFVLYAMGRIQAFPVGPAIIDFGLGTLFLFCYLSLRNDAA